MIEKESRNLVYLRMGDVLIEPRGLHFGLPHAPSKFQLVNRLGVRLVNMFGCRTYLYLDDRCVAQSENLDVPIAEDETTRGLLL